MRILQLHANYMEYQPIKKEIEKAEAVRTERVKVTEVVVVFTSIEEADDRDTATKAADELAISFENLRARRILIYPYSHLSTSLAAPDAALQVLKELASQLENKGYEVHRGPFGWTKSFTISVKGHPLAEQAKTISGIGSTDENVLELESKPRSSFHILNPNGDTTNLDK
ncbi:MAG: threonyl-tRNA synthetase editing domain-containing protein, partial [Nitrososphaerales archaeon]